MDMVKEVGQKNSNEAELEEARKLARSSSLNLGDPALEEAALQTQELRARRPDLPPAYFRKALHSRLIDILRKLVRKHSLPSSASGRNLEEDWIISRIDAQRPASLARERALNWTFDAIIRRCRQVAYFNETGNPHDTWIRQLVMGKHLTRQRRHQEIIF